MSANNTLRPVVLSHREVQPLLRAREAGETAALTSLDLGLTQIEARLAATGVELPDGQWLTWDAVEEIAANEEACFAVEDDGSVARIARFSEALNRAYSLMPTAGPPTILIAGFSMHRIKGTDPRRDTLNKVRTIAPLRGRVLDTSTGLGYTAIEAARTADEVVTIELDPTTLEIARYNPWSRGLFENPKIHQIVGDSYDVVQELPDESFSRIIHDPPIFSLAGHLYSGAYYRQLFRMLRRGGRLFHYIGNLESKQGGGLAKGVVRRLKESGFTRVDRRTEAFGVVAYK